MRPLWLVVGVVTCVLAGATLNQCLTCLPGVGPDTISFLPVVEGAPIDAPLEEPEPEAPREPMTVSEALEKSKPAEEAPPPAPAVKVERDGDHLQLTFDKLASYEYKFPEVGEEKPTNQIPASILKLDGEKISIQGFMIPIKTEGEDVLEFVLVRNQFACCYGVVPRMNEWIHVKMKPGKVSPYALDIPITLYGDLEVGELWENGVVMSLYRMQCDEVVEPPVFR